MPKLKLNAPVKAERVKSGFEAYDGPIPEQRGVYRAILKQVKVKEFSSGNVGFYIVAELEAAKNDVKKHKQFDGFALFIQSIIFQTSDGSPLKEGSANKLANFFDALGIKGEVDEILHDDGDLTAGIDVKKIGGKKPQGMTVNLDVRIGDYQGDKRPEVNEIFVYQGDGVNQEGYVEPKVAKDEDDSEPWAKDDDEADEAAKNDEDEDELRAELKRLQVPALRERAKEAGLTGKGTKQVLIDQIVDAELYADDDEDGDDDEDESPMALADGDDEAEEGEEEDDEEDEEEEDDEEEAEEDEEDDEAVLRAELAPLERKELIRRVKAANSEQKVLKRHSDDEIRDMIVDLELDELPY